MASIYIRIGHENDLVITQLRNVKIVAIAFRKSTSKALIMVLISAFASTLSMEALLHIQILPRIGKIAWYIRSWQFWQNRLRISLDDEYLAFFLHHGSRSWPVCRCCQRKTWTSSAYWSWPSPLPSDLGRLFAQAIIPFKGF